VVTDRQTDRQTHRQTHRQTDTHTNAGKNTFPRFRGDKYEVKESKRTRRRSKTRN